MHDRCGAETVSRSPAADRHVSDFAACLDAGWRDHPVQPAQDVESSHAPWLMSIRLRGPRQPDCHAPRTWPLPDRRRGVLPGRMSGSSMKAWRQRRQPRHLLYDREWRSHAPASRVDPADGLRPRLAARSRKPIFQSIHKCPSLSKVMGIFLHSSY
ncbi:MAG: hypothetical protein MZV64_23575 [Ignavibacteriales bacterium]|nr:hypothetical protein [Ignavibacteriales bacterium]